MKGKGKAWLQRVSKLEERIGNSDRMWFLSGWLFGRRRQWFKEMGMVKFLAVQVIWLRWNANEKESIDSKRRYSLWWGKDISRKQENFCCIQEGRKKWLQMQVNLCVYAEGWGSSHMTDAPPLIPLYSFSLFSFISESDNQISVKNGHGNDEVGV